MRRIIVCTAVGLLAASLAACGTAAKGSSTSTAPTPTAAESAVISSTKSAAIAGPACGAATPGVVAKTVGRVATQIYAREVASMEVRADQKQVESYVPLLGALASGSRAAVGQAVTSLVYSHTHIVRLRVMQGSALLADVGGPYILAPVAGNLRYHGRVVGHYLLSVQDDLGYVKLVTRYIGVPLVLHAGSQRVPLEGTLAPGPASVPDLGPVSYGGASYESFSFKAQAFPRGPLRISLLAPVPRSLSASSCATIRVLELNRIAQRIWRRFVAASVAPSSYVDYIPGLTGVLGFIRSHGRPLAGSTRPAPSRLPSAGTISYRGRTYAVSSFVTRVAAQPARVYLLVP